MERLYDNDPGIAQLYEMRVGAIRTFTYRQRFDSSTTAQSAICRACGEAKESALHIVTQCVGLVPSHPDDTFCLQMLGFEAQDGGAPSSVVAITKERLRKWWCSQPGIGAARDKNSAHGNANSQSAQ
ncbi:hypothetical protein HPB50_010389 [Hyalomma asiaticum]|uniref:Uncharacterized protein n=1 Tax=Hyalomma asiaticum TaxID=266040 RepID=A0ACB7TIM6_HYAAI|nr:hypothetical protein HPB50_010389 [Hyalomma asiaticum]